MGMKINMDNARQQEIMKISKGKEIEKTEIQKGQFGTKLKQMSEANYEERLKQLLENIQGQGEKVAKTMDMKEVLRYKTLISEFLNEVTSGTHAFERQNFLDRRGRHRMYGMVKKVDESLDELTQQVLSKEKDQIKVLKKIEDIRGMLIDIYM